MSIWTELLVSAVGGILGLWAILASAQACLPRAVVWAITMSVLIPTFGPAQSLTTAHVVGAALILALAVLRSTPTGPGWFPLVLAAFIVYTTAIQMVDVPTLRALRFAAQGAAMLLIAIASIMLRQRNDNTVTTTVLALVPVQFAVALAEQLRILPYFWTRSSSAAYQDIALRVNELLPSLVGRSMGTFAHPILLGVFAAIGAIVALVTWRRSRRPLHFALLLLALATLLMSGTRSAAAALAVGVAFWISTMPGRGRLLRAAFALGLGALALTTGTWLSALGLSDIDETASYIHRSEVLGSVPRLLERDSWEVWFGSGAGSTEELFARGVIRGYGTFTFIDNQYVALLIWGGIVGLILFTAAIVAGMLRGNDLSRAWLVIMLVMCASFDVITWGSAYMLLVIALAGGLPIPGSSQSGSSRGGEARAAPRLPADPASAESTEGVTGESGRKARA